MPANVVALRVASRSPRLAATGGAAHLAAGGWAAPLLWLGTRAAAGLLSVAGGSPVSPGPRRRSPPTGPWLSLLHAAGLLAFSLARGRARWLGLLAPAALLFALARPALTAPPLSVTVLSVGHGDAIVVCSRGGHALVDGGGVPGGADPGPGSSSPTWRRSASGG